MQITPKRSLFAAAALLLSVLPLACAAPPASTSTSFSGSSLTSPTYVSSDSDTESEGTDSGEDTESSTGLSAGSGSSGSSGSSGGSSGSGVTDTNPDGLPNGAECSNPEECQTGNCYVIPLPLGDLPSGVCGICDEDQDCVDAGLGIACAIDVEGEQTKCTDGGLGSFCQSNDACKEPLFCTEMIDGVGELLPMTCGTCRTDDDCLGSARCTPSVDVVAYSGNKYCAELGSVAKDGLCPPQGDATCVSGYCTVLDLNFVEVGVCGECSTDEDCPGTCKPAEFSDGFIGSICE